MAKEVSQDGPSKPWERHSTISCAAYLTNQETLDALNYWYLYAGELSARERKAELGTTRKDKHFVLVTEWIGLWAEWMGCSSQTFREASKVYLICAHKYPEVTVPESVYRLRPTKDIPTAADIDTLKAGMEIFSAIRAEMVAAKTMEDVKSRQPVLTEDEMEILRFLNKQGTATKRIVIAGEVDRTEKTVGKALKKLREYGFAESAKNGRSGTAITPKGRKYLSKKPTV